MVPPLETGVSDSSRLTPGRNGALHETRHGARTPLLKTHLMDPNGSRLRKGFGDKWKLSKPGKPETGQMIEASNFMVHPDYLTKYGTLSNGVLTKSIKYAETWLYGTVGVRGAPPQRPSLFLYPGVVPVMSPSYLPVAPYPSRTPFQCGDCGKDVRTANALCKKCVDKRNNTVRKNRPVSVKDRTPDPYAMMRRSRLGDASLEHSQRRKRTASASPLRKNIPNGAAFQTFKPKDAKPWQKNNDEWETDEVGRRRSILECDVNAYELNKSKENVELDEIVQGTSKVQPKLKILRPKIKTEKTEEVRLNGQRFKIFDHSNPSTPVVEGYVSDDEECRKNLLPRLPSPKRPPRRPKDRLLGETGFKYSKSKSKSSPNLSIKSILKKPGGGDDASEEGAARCEEAPSVSETCQQTMQTKKQSQSTLKKKKQVQFRVNVSSESLNRSGRKKEEEENGEVAEDVEEVAGRSMSCENLSSVGGAMGMNERESGKEAESKENKENKEDKEEKEEKKEEEEEEEEVKKEEKEKEKKEKKVTEEKMGGSGGVKEVDREGERGLHIEDEPSQPPQLKRSFSDRRPSSALVLYKDDPSSLSTSPPSGQLFNDTMALRTRAKREDTRGVFVNGDIEGSERVPGNLITYEEFAKRTNSPQLKNEKKTSAKKKSPAPNPPPRQVAAKINKPKTGAISVKVCTEEPKTQEVETINDDGKVLLRLTSSEDAPITTGRKTSITIHPVYPTVVEEPKAHPVRKTSVLINAFDPQDANKVTISVRNDEEPKASTCTIIETGSNSTVIPVMSSDNKTTLIVGSSTPLSSPGDTSSAPTQEPPKPYIFSTVSSEVEFLDPVEAVKRNLVPHVCGKEENGPTLMEKIKQSRETVEQQKSLRQISQLFGRNDEQTNHSLLLSCKNKKSHWKTKPGEDSSTTTSRSNSFCSTINGSVKNSSGNTSRSSSFRSSCCKSLDSDYDASLNKFYQLSDTEETSGQERDKLEYEYEIRNGFKDESKEGENIYETIREEPIYDQIGEKTGEEFDDVPPPLPLTLPPSLDEVDKRSAKSIFEGASKYDILNYLVDAKERVQEECYFSGSSTSEDADGRRENGDATRSGEERLIGKGDISPTTENDSGYDVSSRISNLSQTSYSSDDNMTLGLAEREQLKLTRKSSAEIERNDSGVGSETSHTSRSKWQAASSIREDPQHLCEDCDQAVETQVTDSGVMYAPLVCRKCSKRRSERKEIIQEIVETEEKYGRDLKIILEEFYTPMLVAGLLSPEQLSAIFLNTEELLENSEQLTEKLRDTLEIALDQGDEDFLTVNMGKLFLEAGPMLHAFESYCTRQGNAAVLLANLEKEKELLRIFLRVSQMENAVLRRMNLNSFLMVPVQRVTKYPLLLARLYKVTPSQQEGRELLREAQHNIELHLEHMNSEAKDVSATKVWRRFSTSAGTGRKSTSELEMINIKLRKMAVDVLEWNHEEVRFVLEGKLLYTQPTDNNWKRGRTIKLTPVFVLLVTLGKPNAKYKMEPPDDELTFPTKTGVREATLLLFKEKCGRYTLIREPLYLDKIIVCCEAEADEFFEVQELSTKDSFIFKAEDAERTKEWYKYLQYHAQILGAWRRRRNALANIMINGMMARAYSG